MKRKEIYTYICTFALCFFILYLNLHGANLSIPLIYAGDGLLNLIWIKSVLENGWYLHNTLLGAPFWLDMHDFPMSEGFNFLIIKLMSLFTSNASIVINLFYLLTYPLTAATSLFVMRFMKLRAPIAIVGSLLFTFLPYHYLRGEAHLFLAGYYMIPLITLVIFWVWQGDFNRKKWITSILLLAIVGSSGIYYAFFSCFLLIMVGLIMSFNKRNIKQLLIPICLILVILLVGLINLAPNIIYSFQNGANPEAVKRSYIESEIYGLKITNLILPVNDHRVGILAKIKDQYNTIAPLNNENTTATLGLVGTLGFIVLICSLFINNVRDDLKKLGILNIITLLLTSIGGIGTLVSIFLTSEIRGYNRFGVFIAFYSILAICILINKWKSNYVFLLTLFILIIGIYDQTSTKFNPQNDYMRSEYVSDEEFVNSIENIMPRSSMVFQLPYMQFPENGPIFNMGDYDLAKAYLHSKSLKWSYGAMKGRSQDIWIRNVSNKTTEEMLQTLSFAGFNGIYIDRNGYEDNANLIVKELKGILKVEPIKSNNERLVFFSMKEYNKIQRNLYDQDNWELKKENALNPVIVSWGKGFYGLETDNSKNWRWSSQQGDMLINNLSAHSKTVNLDMTFVSGSEVNSDLTISGDLISESIKINSKGLHYKKTLEIPPGEHLISFECNAAKIDVKEDPRDLVFRVVDFKLLNKN
ncbi:hypothetical protein [Paenibacillus monticola]|uniref:Sugar translocase n=1 Tax=Paenibacillus monticola TaxID=2666075 RepID=A0A7X2L2N1_9BACL|nr:hypothetical protein [Paenibacillus monticola]MRN54370.1 hypothetical protein [Paenibacillus monticola]